MGGEECWGGRRREEKEEERRKKKVEKNRKGRELEKRIRKCQVISSLSSVLAGEEGERKGREEKKRREEESREDQYKERGRREKMMPS